MSSFSTADLQVLEQMVATNFKDAVLTSNLGKLQAAQLVLT